MTFAPSLAMNVAAAAPIPLAAPVTIATFPFKDLLTEFNSVEKLLFN